jgi:hypothetical protein
MNAQGQRYVVYDGDPTFDIWHFSDLHLFSQACSINRLMNDISACRANPYGLALGGGDYCDFINYHDKRFDPDSVESALRVRDLGRLGKLGVTRVKKLFMPIRHKILGMAQGNHEFLYAKYTEYQDLHKDMCTRLRVPDLGYCSLFDLIFIRCPGATPRLLELGEGIPSFDESHTYRIFVHHGAGFASTPGGKMNRLIGFMNSFRADIYFCGHVHDQVARREPVISADNNCKNLVAHDRIGVISGSYLKTYDQNSITYGEQRGYHPVALGAARVLIRPMTDEKWALV